MTAVAATAPQFAIRIDHQQLDPINVLITDTAPGQGRIIIQCYSECLTYFWDAHGSDKLIDFIAKKIDKDYFIGKVLSGNIPKNRRGYLKRVAEAAFHGIIIFHAENLK